MNRLAALFGRSSSLDPRADGALLAAFLADRDEPAFAELVRRHGPLVWGVCRRLLPDPADAEDAFQAAFLVLVRRARRLTTSPTVGPWLYRVAAWTARNLRRKNARRLAHSRELSAAAPDSRSAPEPPFDLDAALLGLSERHRAAVVLCCLQGLTHREAAERLGCAEGTVSSLVSRGLAKLRTRFAGRDPATVFAAVAVASVPSALTAATVRSTAAVHLASLCAAASPAVTTLAEGVLRMFWMKKATAGLVAAVALLTAGVVVGVAVRQIPQAVADETGDAPSRWASPGPVTSAPQAVADETGDAPTDAKPTAPKKDDSPTDPKPTGQPKAGGPAGPTRVALDPKYIAAGEKAVAAMRKAAEAYEKQLRALEEQPGAVGPFERAGLAATVERLKAEVAVMEWVLQGGHDPGLQLKLAQLEAEVLKRTDPTAGRVKPPDAPKLTRSRLDLEVSGNYGASPYKVTEYTADGQPVAITFFVGMTPKSAAPLQAHLARIRQADAGLRAVQVATDPEASVALTRAAMQAVRDAGFEVAEVPWPIPDATATLARMKPEGDLTAADDKGFTFRTAVGKHGALTAEGITLRGLTAYKGRSEAADVQVDPADRNRLLIRGVKPGTAVFTVMGSDRTGRALTIEVREK